MHFTFLHVMSKTWHWLFFSRLFFKVCLCSEPWKIEMTEMMASSRTKDRFACSSLLGMSLLYGSSSFELCHLSLFTLLLRLRNLCKNEGTLATIIAVRNKLSSFSDQEFHVFCQHPWNWHSNLLGYK